MVELLADHSLDRLTIGRITERAGVTRTAFYFYFESKYAVVAAALTEVWSEFDEARLGVHPDDVVQDPRAAVQRAIADALGVWRRHSALLGACLSTRGSDQQLGAMWSGFVQRTTERVTGVITELRDQGLVSPISDDVETLVMNLLGMVLWSLAEDSALGADAERTSQGMAAVWLATALRPASAAE